MNQAPPAWLQSAMGDAPASAMQPPAPAVPGAPPPPMAPPRAPAPDEGGAPSSLTDAFKSGALTFKAGEQVPVKLADGSIGTVDARDTQHVVDNGGEIVEHGELHAAQMEARYGGVGGGLGAAGAGFARGLTIGLSDPVALGIAGALGGQAGKESLRERLAAYQEVHPYASAAGEVAGVVAPALLSGGAGAVAEGARVAGALPEGIGALGRLAERGVGRLVGDEATSLGGRIIQQAAKKAAAGAAEGALFNLGSEISESALGDTQLTGEKMLAALGHGALMGGAVGGALGATGEVLKAGAAKAAPFLRAKAEEEAFKSINARKAFTDQAEKIPGKARGVGRQLLDDGIIEAGDTIETIAPKVAEARQAAGKKIGDILESADKAGVEGPKLQQIAKRVHTDVIADLEKMGTTNAGAIGSVKGLLQDLYGFSARAHGGEVVDGLFSFPGRTAEETKAMLADARLTFQQAQEFRSRLDDLIKWNTSPLSPVNEKTNAFKAVRNIIEDELTSAGDAATSKLGTSFRKDYEAAKLTYRRYALADKAAQDAASRGQANASHSLTDKIFGAAGGAVGATHGPAGMAVGLLAGQASRYVRTRGNAMLATWLDKLSTLSTLSKRTTAVDAELEGGLSGFFARARDAESKPKLRVKTVSRFDGRRPRDEYEQRAAELAHVKTNREALARHVAETTAELAPHAPETTKAIAATAQRAATFLSSKLPKQPGAPPGVVSLARRIPQPSDHEVATFLRYARAVDNPVSVLDDLHRGKLSREGVEAIREVYPAIYNQVHATMLRRVQEMQAKGTPIPYQQNVELGMLLDLPTDWSVTPAGVKALQQIITAPPAKSPEGPQGGPQTQGPSRPVQTPQSRAMQTDVERREGGQIR